jgi:hypothetical protein
VFLHLNLSADVDGNHVVDKEELHIVLASLNPSISLEDDDDVE